LLVEDEASVRELTATILEHLGYRALTAENGEDALNVLRARNDIELVITDVVMPGAIDGVELAGRCRTLKPDMPVMLVSGHPLETRVSSRGEPWPDALLQKPYRMEEFARFVAKMLAAQRRSS
jgi:CheY-like chemotaxis protein